MRQQRRSWDVEVDDDDDEDENSPVNLARRIVTPWPGLSEHQRVRVAMVLAAVVPIAWKGQVPSIQDPGPKIPTRPGFRPGWVVERYPDGSLGVHPGWIPVDSGEGQPC
jgi:hypothetical protein